MSENHELQPKESEKGHHHYQEAFEKLHISLESELSEEQERLPESVEISKEQPQHANLTDVTELFLRLKSKLSPAKVVKAEQFNLFAGTYALEINNSKLDTGLIPEDFPKFETTCLLHEVYTSYSAIQHVNNILNHLIKYLVTWMDDETSNSLSTTLLSCKYVQFLLEEYTKTLQVPSTFSTGTAVYDQLLRCGIVGILYFVKFIKSKVNPGFVFEEEDMHLSMLNLNCLSEIPNPCEIVSDLKDLKAQYCLGQSDIDLAKLEHTLDIIIGICEIEHLLDNGSSCEAEETFSKLINSCEAMAVYDKDEYTLPPNLFSMQVQKTLSNFVPPKSLVPPIKAPYRKFISILGELKTVFTALFDLSNPYDINQFVYYYFTTNKQLNVITRILYPHVLCENGDVNFVNMQYVVDDLESVVLLNQDSKSMILDYMNNFLQYDVESLQETLGTYYNNFASNHCRYRQGYNRQLLMWDSLQARFSMHEETSSGSDASTSEENFPEVTSYVYYRKLKNMLEFQFRGFHLEIYAPWETFSIYWHCYDLLLNLDYLLNKMIHHNDSIIDRLERANLSKNLKKKYKLVEKRKAVKQKNQNLLQKAFRIRKNLSLEQNVAKIYSILSLVQLLQFARLYRVWNSEDKAKYEKFMKDQLLHDLRFKSFQSFGIPQTPELKTILGSLQMFVASQEKPGADLESSIKTQLETCKMAIKTVLEEMQTTQTNNAISEDAVSISVMPSRVNGTALDWFVQLQKTCDAFLESYGPASTSSSSSSSQSSFYPSKAAGFDNGKNNMQQKSSIQLNLNKDTHMFFPLYS